MRHNLYEVAAKCFLRGEDYHKYNTAMAFQQALLAARTKESNQKQREQFVKAAVMFLDCDQLHQAAKCLVNAREKVLVAFLYEKIGQVSTCMLFLCPACH